MTTNQEIAIAIIAAFAMVGVLTLMGAYLIIGMARDRTSRRNSNGASVNPGLPLMTGSGWALTWRALRRKCPVCGIGDIFKSHFKMNPTCPRCGAVFFKNEGEWLGPAVLDYTVAIGGALVTWAVTVFIGCSEAVQLGAAAVVAFGGLIGLAPWTRSFWALLLYICGEIESGDSTSAAAPPPRTSR